MTDEPPLEAAELLRRLGDAHVDFVVIGGVAMSLLGSDRNTLDLDICFSRDRDNLDRLGEALVALGARLRGIEDEVEFVLDARTLDRVELLTLDTPFGRLDLLAAPAGAPRYATLVRKAEVADLDGIEVRFASLEHMLAMKEAAGRDRDRVAVEELKAIRRLRRGDPARDSFGQTTADILRKLRDTPADE